MIAYLCDPNVILACPFKSRKDEHRLAAFETIMGRIKAAGHDVDLQILDNEASQKYRDLITEKWNHKFQLVPPNMHVETQPNELFARSRRIFWPFSSALPQTSLGTCGTSWCPRPR